MSKDTKKSSKSSIDMPAVFQNVAGIDIGATQIHVCVPNQNQEMEVRVFETTTPELKKIAKWLRESKIQSAAMEATGVYWIPLYEILEDAGLHPCLIDAKSAKNVPGRKTDVLDCQWIQKLFSCGLLRPAFRPSKDKEKFRALMRHRSILIRRSQTSVLVMHKALLLMNIKLDVALSEVASVTGLDIIRAIVEGERNPQKLAQLRNRHCKNSEEVFVKALTGNFQEAHLFSLRQSLELFDFLGKQIKACDKEIELDILAWKTKTEAPPPPANKKTSRQYEGAKKIEQNSFNFDIRAVLFQKTGIDLSSLPCIGAHTAAVIMSELGGEEGIKSFKSAKHFASWLGLCPGNNISGGKSHGGRSKKCRNRIKQAISLAVMSLYNAKTALGAFYRRLAARISKTKAIKAAAHKLARMIYDAMSQGIAYVEAGQEKYEKQYEERRLKGLNKAAKQMGYTLVPISA
jgi:transposase